MRIFLSIFLFVSVVLASSSTEDSIINSFDTSYTKKQKKDFDPLKDYNIIMTNLNDKFYTHILFPIAKGYKKVIPSPARKSVSNFFSNLLFPVRFINNMLQFKFKNSIEESGRFLINSTIGLAGLFDVAKKQFKLQAHNEDFGQTLGYYGFGGGFYIVWPILGPSNFRDSIGFIADSFIDPTMYIDDRDYNIIHSDGEAFMLRSFNIINKASFNYKKYEAIKKGNVFLYPVLKELYEKHREKLIKE